MVNHILGLHWHYSSPMDNNADMVAVRAVKPRLARENYYWTFAAAYWKSMTPPIGVPTASPLVITSSPRTVFRRFLLTKPTAIREIITMALDRTIKSLKCD